jgi:hypothetical protein
VKAYKEDGEDVAKLDERFEYPHLLLFFQWPFWEEGDSEI